MKPWKTLLLALTLTLLVGSAGAEAAMPQDLMTTAQAALLDGCQSVSFLPALWYDDTYVYGQVLVGDAQWLSSAENGNAVDVYALFHCGVFGWREDMLVDEFTFSIGQPVHLRFEKNGGAYVLISYETPGYAAYEEDVKRMFPAALHDQLLAIDALQAADASVYERLYARAQAYFEGNKADANCRAALPFDIEDDAYESIRTCFAAYPQWEGRLIRPDGEGSFISYQLSVQGEGYLGVLTFDAVNAAGQTLEHAVVQYVDGELKVLEGTLPNAG